MRARSISRYWNISGVTTSESATSMASSSACVSTESLNTRSAVSTLTLELRRQPAVTPARVDAVSNVPLGGDQDRQVLLHPVDAAAVTDSAGV